MKRNLRATLLSIAALLSLSSAASAQQDATPSPTVEHLTAPVYTPVTTDERVDWWAEQSFGVRSLGVGAFTSGFWTWRNQPPEWGSGLSGFGRRYGTRQSEVAISSTLEASLGSVWGEDPRYLRSGRKRFWGRVGWAVRSAFLAYRRDGTQAPAFARGAAFVGSRAVTSTWRPESERRWWNYSLVPLGTGFGTRIGANLFLEFAPDVFGGGPRD
jgi:hypothetical protein